ncbi:MAG: hypothetical protein KBT82_04325 [Marinobacter sp.]|uniref:hypothetical protein n=1 Tax=Marinobacter sp. TaxID=50741 RepID=UPI001B5F4E03|nr:hypothetical protein [Marinobacter sp.]MBQ0813397.1 hypothetical protein [Marinobacter sp.]
MSSDHEQLRSSGKARVTEIISALKAAHEHSLDACEKPLHQMPEYFMVTRVGEHFAARFSNFRYHMEASVADLLTKAGVSDVNQKALERFPELRPNGRFDLALYTRKRGRPAHIIEFKKGAKLEALKKDIDRLALLADSVPERSRLETSYLVFITKRTHSRDISDWNDRLQEIVADSLIGQGKISNDVACTVKDIWKESEQESDTARDRFYGYTPFSIVIVEIRCL